jgi:hypothetical protein
MKILLRRNEKIGSRIIRWATGEPASHVGVSFDGAMVYHSDQGGCRAEPIEDFCRGSVYHIEEIPEPRFARWRAREKIGTKYDTLGVIGFGIFLILRKFGIKSRIPLMNPRWFYCSEYVEYILFGTYSTMTPMQVYEKSKKG